MRSHASKQTSSGSAFAQMMRQKNMNDREDISFPPLHGMHDSLLPSIAAYHPPAGSPTQTFLTSERDATGRELSAKTPPAELLRVIGGLQRELSARTDSVNAIQRNFERLSKMYRQDQAELARITTELKELKEASKNATSREKVLLAVQLELESAMQKHKELLVEIEQEREKHRTTLAAAETQQTILQETCERLSKDKMILCERVEMLERKYEQANADIASIDQKFSFQMQEYRKTQRRTLGAFVRRVGAAIEECIDSIETSASGTGSSGTPRNAGGNTKEAPDVVCENEDSVISVVDVEPWEPWMEAAEQDLLSRITVLSATFKQVLSAAFGAMPELSFSFVIQSIIEPAEECARQQLEELEIYGRGVLQWAAHSSLDIASCTLAKVKEDFSKQEKVLQEECGRLRSCAHEFALWCETALQHACDGHLASLDSYLDGKSLVLLDIALAIQTYSQKQAQRADEMSTKLNEIESRLTETTRDYEKRISTVQEAHSRALEQKKQEEGRLKVKHSQELQFLRDRLRESLQQKEQLLSGAKGDFERAEQDFKAQVDSLKLANSHAEEQRRTEWRQIIEIMNAEAAARMAVMTEENVYRLSEERAAGATLIELAVKNYERARFLQQGAFEQLEHAEDQQRSALQLEECQRRISVLQYFWRTQSRHLELAHRDDMELVRREETAKLREIIQTRDRQHLCELDDLLKQLDIAKTTETQLQKELTKLQCSLRDDQAMGDKKRRAVFSAVGCLLSAEEASESGYSCLRCLCLLKTPQTCVPCGHTFCAACLLEHPSNKGGSEKMREGSVGRARRNTPLFCPECNMQNVQGIVHTRALEELATKFAYKKKVLRDILAYLSPDAAGDGKALEIHLGGDDVLSPS